jgi:hypothetical protein
MPKIAENAEKCSKFTISAVSQSPLLINGWLFFMAIKIYSYLVKLRLLFYLRDQKLKFSFDRVDLKKISIQSTGGGHLPQWFQGLFILDQQANSYILTFWFV